VLYHNDDSTGSRQTVDVLHWNEDKLDNGSVEAWLYIDDEVLSAVRQEDVLGGHDNERVDDRCTYMLFYCRTAPAWTCLFWSSTALLLTHFSRVLYLF
jgi:hypothetical protein